jgi:hypothetical protein
VVGMRRNYTILGKLYYDITSMENSITVPQKVSSSI